MSIFGNLIIVLANFLDIFFTVYSFVIIVSAVLSWVNPDPYNPIVRFIYRITEPFLHPIRKMIPLRLPIDISPMILLLLIYLLQQFLIPSIIEFGYRVKGGTS